MGEDGTQYKNEYVFIKSNDVNYVHKGYTSQFSLRPEMKSFYSITVTSVNSIDDVDIKVTYVNERLFLSDKTIKVNQYSDATYDSNNHSATFYYLLEPDNDTAYTICINNNTGCETYEVRVSQDNWAFAPNGGLWTLVDYGAPLAVLVATTEKMYITPQLLADATVNDSNEYTIYECHSMEDVDKIMAMITYVDPTSEATLMESVSDAFTYGGVAL